MLSINLRLGLPSGLFPSGFPTNNLYTFLLSPIRARPYVLHNSTLCKFSVPPTSVVRSLAWFPQQTGTIFLNPIDEQSS
jgi:hypothetical protein